MTTVAYDPDLDPVLAALEARLKEALAMQGASLTAQIAAVQGALTALDAKAS